MDAAAIVRAMRGRREIWIEVEPASRDVPAKRVLIRRPTEAEMIEFRGLVGVEHVAKYVVGWEGYTEADLLGADVGADELVAFDPTVWAEYVSDRLDLATKAAKALGEAIDAHQKAKADTAKN